MPDLVTGILLTLAILVAIAVSLLLTGTLKISVTRKPPRDDQ